MSCSQVYPRNLNTLQASIGLLYKDLAIFLNFIIFLYRGGQTIDMVQGHSPPLQVYLAYKWTLVLFKDK